MGCQVRGPKRSTEHTYRAKWGILYSQSECISVAILGPFKEQDKVQMWELSEGELEEGASIISVLWWQEVIRPVNVLIKALERVYLIVLACMNILMVLLSRESMSHSYSGVLSCLWSSSKWSCSHFLDGVSSYFGRPSERTDMPFP